MRFNIGDIIKMSENSTKFSFVDYNPAIRFEIVGTKLKKSPLEIFKLIYILRRIKDDKIVKCAVDITDELMEIDNQSLRKKKLEKINEHKEKI